MKKRFIAALLALVTLSLMLTGCDLGGIAGGDESKEYNDELESSSGKWLMMGDEDTYFILDGGKDVMSFSYVEDGVEKYNGKYRVVHRGTGEDVYSPMTLIMTRSDKEKEDWLYCYAEDFEENFTQFTVMDEEEDLGFIDGTVYTHVYRMSELPYKMGTYILEGNEYICLGPLALTSMLVSFSVLIPLIWGFAVRKESLNCAQITAIILLICAIALTNADKILVKCKSSAEKNCKQKSKYGLWWICVFATFFCNGICSILQKEHQMFYNGSYSKEFMFFAMLLCSIIFSGVLLFRFSLTRLRTVKGSLFGVLSGIGNGLANYLTLTLAGLEKASVLFPIISSGTLLGSIVCGKFLFKEKLRIHHYLAIVAGIIAVILLKL